MKNDQFQNLRDMIFFGFSFVGAFLFEIIFIILESPDIVQDIILVIVFIIWIVFGYYYVKRVKK